MSNYIKERNNFLSHLAPSARKEAKKYHESKYESDKDLAKENRPHRLEIVEAQDRKNNANAKKQKMAHKMRDNSKETLRTKYQSDEFKNKSDKKWKDINKKSGEFLKSKG